MLTEYGSPEEDLILGKENIVSAVISPRVIILTPRGVPMVRNGDWLGLPGGKVKIGESFGDLMSIDAFPTLTREVQEECDLDISRFLMDKSACLGLAEINIVDSINRKMRYMLAPIFICLTKDLPNGNEDLVWRPLNSESYNNIFPDASFALKHLQQQLKNKSKGFILPEFLNKDVVYFQTKPVMMYLPKRPDWAPVE
jgi:8-oxo-dGTP pyrophosphatase MutT (NUDIX family)